MRNDTTRCYPRTMREAFGLSASDAVAMHKYTMPLSKRFFYALIRWGWTIIPALLAVEVLTCCADEAKTWAADQASLADAIAQAAKEAGK